MRRRAMAPSAAVTRELRAAAPARTMWSAVRAETVRAAMAVRAVRALTPRGSGHTPSAQAGEGGGDLVRGVVGAGRHGLSLYAT